MVNINETNSGLLAFLEFVDNGIELKITGNVTGISPGPHGFHIHEDAFVDGDCLTAGTHLDGDPPLGNHHGNVGEGK